MFTNTLLTPVQVKEEFLEQAWSVLMEDCEAEISEMQNGQNGAEEEKEAEAEEKGAEAEDWGEDLGEMGEEENGEDDPLDPLVEESGC